MAYRVATEASVPERLYAGLMALIESRGCKIDRPDFSREAFLEDFGHQYVQIATTKTGTSDRFLIVVLSGGKSDNIDSKFGTMDPKMRDPSRSYRIDTLVVHNMPKYGKHQAFTKYGVHEHVKTYAQIICNPLTTICAYPACIVPIDDIIANMLRIDAIAVIPHTDPVVFWLDARPGQIIKEQREHENAGEQLAFRRVE